MIKVERLSREWMARKDIECLFERAFLGENERFGVDPIELCGYLYDHVEDPGKDSSVDHWLNCWGVHHYESGWVGFAIGSYTPWPLCPNPTLAFVYCERSDCREPLLTKAWAWAYGYGLRYISLSNGSGHSDESYQRLFRKFGHLEKTGSVMVCDLEVRNGNSA